MAQGRWVNVPGKGKRWQQPSGELMMTKPGFGPGEFFQTRAGEILAPIKNIASPSGPLQGFADFLNRNQIGARGVNAQTVPQVDQSLLGRVPAPGTGVNIPTAPVTIPAGTVNAGAIVKGLTPAGTVDYTQGDEYKSQMAQYQNLIKQEKQAEAEDLGMKIWMEKYAKTPMAQAGGAIGAYNPLLAATFPETKGFAGTFATPEEVQMGDLGTRAQGEMGPTMETLNPLASQAAQQEATATQADMATTAGMSAGDRARNLTRAFRLGLI